MKNICGQCKKGFDSEQDYLDHECRETGFKPTDPDNLGEGFKDISDAALERGSKRSELEQDGKSSEEAVKLTRGVGKIVR